MMKTVVFGFITTSKDFKIVNNMLVLKNGWEERQMDIGINILML